MFHAYAAYKIVYGKTYTDQFFAGFLQFSITHMLLQYKSLV